MCLIPCWIKRTIWQKSMWMLLNVNVSCCSAHVENVWFLTLSSALSRIWLSGMAPSRLNQRSSTRSFSFSSSLSGSTSEPRARPQLWESYTHQTHIKYTPEQKESCHYCPSDINAQLKINIYWKMQLLTLTTSVSSVGLWIRKWKASSHCGEVERLKT